MSRWSCCDSRCKHGDSDELLGCLHVDFVFKVPGDFWDVLMVS